MIQCVCHLVVCTFVLMVFLLCMFVSLCPCPLCVQMQLWHSCPLGISSSFLLCDTPECPRNRPPVCTAASFLPLGVLPCGFSVSSVWEQEVHPGFDLILFTSSQSKFTFWLVDADEILWYSPAPNLKCGAFTWKHNENNGIRLKSMVVNKNGAHSY